MSFSVAQNTSFLTVASILQKVVSSVYFFVVARLIGVENTGSYFFAITFTTIFTVIADFGFAPILTREAAKYPEKSGEYFKTIFYTKIIFGLLAYAMVMAAVNLLNYSGLLKDLIYLSGLTMIFDNLQTCFFSIFRARKNLLYESAWVVCSQLITLVVGSLALFLHWPLIWLIAAYTIPSGVALLYGSYFLRRDYGINLSFAFDRKIFKYFFVLAIPFAMAGILGRLYSYSDTLIMSKLLTEKDLGLWALPYKIVFAFQFIPVALSASVYPAISALSVSEPERIGDLFTKSWRYLFAIVFPLSLGIIAVAEPLIKQFYPSFVSSVPVLRILLVSLIFGYLSIITGALLNATNHQKIQTSLVAVALVSNVALNLILIRKFGIVGAAYAALFSNFLLCILGYIFAKKYVLFSAKVLLKSGAKSLGLALIMSILVYFLTSKYSIFVTIPVGVVFYGVLLFVSGTIDRRSLKEVWGKVAF